MVSGSLFFLLRDHRLYLGLCLFNQLILLAPNDKLIRSRPDQPPAVSFYMVLWVAPLARGPWPTIWLGKG